MTIKLLKQNLEYFRHSNNIIKAEELDNRINDIVNYLNNEIIFNLNNINDNIIAGSTIQNEINSILKSKSDAGYYWKKIDKDDFLDNSININKINYKTSNNSIFIANNNGNIDLIKNQNLYYNIIVCDNNGVKFDKLNNNYINPLTKITGDKIQFYSITSNNLINIVPTISYNSIIGSHFKQRVITKEKIADNTISLNSFNIVTQNLLKNFIWKEIIPNNFINLNSVSNRNNVINSWDRYFLTYYAFNYQMPIGQYKKNQYTISLDKFSNFYVKNIIKYYSNIAKITDLSLTDPNGKKVGAEKRYILSPNNFKPNSINPNRLICWYHKQNNEKCHNINKILAPNSITIDNLSPAIKTKIG